MNEKDFYVLYDKYKNATSFDYEKDKKDFMARNEFDNTIAHLLAWYNNNFLPTDMEILSLINDEGVTVAHELAMCNKNFLPTDPKILSLKDLWAVTVRAYINKRLYNNLKRKKKDTLDYILEKGEEEFNVLTDYNLCSLLEVVTQKELLDRYCINREKTYKLYTTYYYNLTDYVKGKLLEMLIRYDMVDRLLKEYENAEHRTFEIDCEILYELY